MQIRKKVVFEGSNSRVVDALIDTGASMTLLPKKFADEIGVKYTGERRRFTGAFEGGYDNAYIANVNLRFPFLNDAYYSAVIAVSEKATEVLIGLDIFNALKIRIDSDTGHIVVKDETVDLVKDGLAIAGIVAIGIVVLSALFGNKR